MIDVRHYGIDGPHVVLLHGGPGAPGYMAALARDLSANFRVIEPLQRLSNDKPLTVSQHVADLNKVIQSVGEPVQLVGSSWGAMLALTYAARHIERINQLVLIGCGTFDTETRDEYRRRMQSLTTDENAVQIQTLKKRMAEASDRDEISQLFAEYGQLGFFIQSYELLSTDFEVTFYDKKGHEETWADAMRLQESGIQPEEFKNIACPVHMLHGESDPHPGRLIYDSLKLHIKQLTYHEFSHCGHVPWLEKQARDGFLTELKRILFYKQS